MKTFKFKLFSFLLTCSLCFPVYPVPRPAATPIAINIITNDQGEKLYVLELDSNNEVNCYGDCTRDWPEIQIEKTKHARNKGQVQVMINSKPLQYFDQETRPNNGTFDGNGSVWHVTTPSKF